MCPLPRTFLDQAERARRTVEQELMDSKENLSQSQAAIQVSLLFDHGSIQGILTGEVSVYP
jgi:hypothetical protein